MWHTKSWETLISYSPPPVLSPRHFFTDVSPAPLFSAAYFSCIEILTKLHETMDSRRRMQIQNFRDESSVYIFQKAARRIVRVRSPSRVRQQIAAWVDGSASYWSELMDPGQANPFKTGLWRGWEQRHWSPVGLNRSSSGHSIMGQ